MSNAVTTIEPRQKSVLLDMAGRFNMEPAAFEATVRKTCGADKCTREEFAAFLLVAKEYELNPILREIYAFPKRGGGIVPVVAIDGWVNLINSHPQCDGFDFAMEHDGQGKLISCTCTMYRKDRKHPTVVTEYFDECHRATEPWKMAHRMLRHKALIQAGRYAFGFAGIYDEDEAARIAQVANAAPATERPKLSDYREPADGAEPTDVEVETEAEAEPDADPFFFTDAFGTKGEEPLNEADFYGMLVSELDQVSTSAAMEALLGHNQDDIDRLNETAKELLGASIDQNNRRLRDLAVEVEREAQKQAAAAKAKPAETAPAAPTEAAPESAAAPAESENPAPPEEAPSRVIPLQYGPTGQPREQAYFATLKKAFKAETVPDDVRRVWQANKADIEKCAKYWQGEIEKAAKARVEELEKPA